MHPAWFPIILITVTLLGLFLLARALFVPKCNRNQVWSREQQACMECATDADCGYGFVCMHDHTTHTQQCVACKTSQDCAFGAVCNSSTHQCILPCATDSDCILSNSSCVSGICSSEHTGPSPSFVHPAQRTSDACEAYGGTWDNRIVNQPYCRLCDARSYLEEGFCDSRGRKVSCLRDDHCDGNFVCDNSFGACVPANLSSHTGLFGEALHGKLFSLSQGGYLRFSDDDGPFSYGAGGDAVAIVPSLSPDSAGAYLVLLHTKRFGWRILVPRQYGISLVTRSEFRDIRAVDTKWLASAWRLIPSDTNTLPISASLAQQGSYSPTTPLPTSTLQPPPFHMVSFVMSDSGNAVTVFDSGAITQRERSWGEEAGRWMFVG